MSINGNLSFDFIRKNKNRENLGNAWEANTTTKDDFEQFLSKFDYFKV